MVEEANHQLIGMRFQNIPIPQGTTIVNAEIQFTSDQTDNQNPSSIIFRGEDIDDAPTFTGGGAGTNDISGRTPTTESVTWSPPNWTTTGTAGPDQLTNDLSPIIQEIIDRPLWDAGNSLVIMTDDASTGKRTADSEDTNAPVLSITYEEEIPPIEIAVGRFQITGGQGQQSITGVGFEPKAYILMMTSNDNDNENAPSGEAASLSIGATDGKNSFVVSTADEADHNDEGRSDTGRRAVSGYVLSKMRENAGNSETRGAASHVSMDPDGFTILKTDTFAEPGSFLVEYIAFGGEGVTPHVGHVLLDPDQNDAVSESGLDFEPDVLLTAFTGPWNKGRAAGASNQRAMSISLGWAVNPDIQAANNQFSMAIGTEDNQDTADTWSRFDTTNAGTSGFNNADETGFEITGFDSNGFTATTRLGAADTDPYYGFGYLALDLGDSPEIYSTSRGAATSTGDDDENGAGFTPVFLLGIGGAEVTAAEINTLEDDASLAIGISNGTHSYSLSMRDDDNRGGGTGTMNVTTRTGVPGTFLEGYPDSSNSLDYVADFNTFDSNGWKLDYTNAASSAWQIAFLAIGDKYYRAAPDPVDYMQPDAAAPGMNVAVSF